MLFCLSILLFLLLLVYLIPVFENPESESVEGSQCWMKELDDGLFLSEIILPGSHNCAARYARLPYFSRCQTLGIREQLDAGVRYLDIRLAQDNDRLKLVHGSVDCTESGAFWAGALSLDTVLEECCSFLSENSSETIIFTVKKERGGDSTSLLEKTLSGYIGRSPEMWLLTDSIPRLADARGKLVLFRRYPDEASLGMASGIPFSWTEQGGKSQVFLHTAEEKKDLFSLWVQDRFHYGTEDKWNAFLKGMKDGETGSTSAALNFLSTTGPYFAGHSYRYAKELNERLLSVPFEEEKGWIILDFITPVLSQHIYQANRGID